MKNRMRRSKLHIQQKKRKKARKKRQAMGRSSAS